jgi:BirA family biotin operon repressor/biotin-[acetyl-CoA-carboxylase] ligase
VNGPPPGLVAALVNGPSIVGAVEWHDAIESTNSRAAELAREGADQGQLVLSDLQTAGRGRQGRGWDAPRGTSLLSSMVVRPRVRPEQLGLLPLLAGLAMAEAVAPFVLGARVGLKWPNDLLLDDRKAAGVLVEVVDGTACVIGVGCNVDWHGVERGAGLGAAATSLTEVAGVAIDRWRLLAAYVGVFGNRYASWQEAPTAFLDDYRGRSSTLGRRVRVHPVGRPHLLGTATGITADGALELTGDDRLRHVLRAGDVEHIRPA